MQLRARVLEALTGSRDPIVSMIRIERVLSARDSLTMIGANVGLIYLTVCGERALIGCTGIGRETARSLPKARQLRFVVLRAWSRGVRADAVQPDVRVAHN